MNTQIIIAGRVAALFLAAICPALATPGIDSPIVDFTATRTGEEVVLSWFGDATEAYQLESGTALTAWASLGPVVNGTGAPVSVPVSIAGQNRGFFRVKRVAAGTVTANFNQGTAILTVTGDNLRNEIVVSRDAAGVIRVHNGTAPVPVQGGTPTVANTVIIQGFGLEGNDVLCLDESNGALPRAQLFGEAGNDTLRGGSGADLLNGGPGSDTLFGMGGTDTLLGGEGDDTITGGDDDDTAQMGPGNDRFIWNPGDDTDIVEGSDDTDTAEVNGGGGAEGFTATANGIKVRFDRLNPAPFSLDLGTCEKLVLNANGGNDSFSATGDLASLIQITVDGGAGEDTITGSNGMDVLLGGENNDFIDGQQGIDVIFMGPGDDVFQWDPGDGLDTIEGETGADTLLFNGSAGNEIFELTANGARLRFTRNLGNIVLDLAGVETVQCNALGGVDSIIANDLTGTDVNALNIHLASTIGGNLGDALVDTVIVHGTTGVDNVTVTQVGTGATISGLKALVSIFTGDVTDAITINGQAGNDTINASAVLSQFVLTIDGGAGDDTITGGFLTDVLLGGPDKDAISGRQGADTVFGGTGDDTFLWIPGDGNDVLEGQEGTDTLRFTGAGGSENIDLTPNGPRFRLFRSIANVTLDCDDVETVELNVLAGADNITAAELTTTDVKNVIVKLEGPNGGGDLEPDTIVVTGTALIDNIVVGSPAANVAVTGLSSTFTISGTEAANDRLTINALAEADIVNAAGLPSGLIQLTLNGGVGIDVMTGSQGGDVFTGGDGNDTTSGGGGDDTFVWNPGDDNDTVEGQAGSDTLLFNGAIIGENIDISANGTRLRFFRNVANVLMDCAGVELVHFNALGGPDVITVNDLTGTGVTGVTLALGASIGSNTGDGQPDNVTITGTAARDTVLVLGSIGSLSVVGLSASVTITGSEGANDTLAINVLGGDDLVDASDLSSGVIALTVDGGIDHDTIIGSDGNDVLVGGDGDDVLIGGPGLDTLNGGSGTNVLIQD